MNPNLMPEDAASPTDSWSFLERSSVLAPATAAMPLDVPEPLQVSTDGRVARRQRNRHRVVEAYVHLLMEGNTEPTTEALAAVADVTPRSVYRYMSTDSTLKADVADRIVSILRPPCTMDASALHVLDDRIAMFVAYHLDAREKAAPIMRAIRNRPAAGSMLIEPALAVPDEQVTTCFAPELGHLEDADRPVLMASMQTLVSFDSLELLFEHLGPDRSVIEAALCRNLRAIVLAACPAAIDASGVEPSVRAR